MTRLLLLTFAAGFGLAWWLCSRTPAQTSEPVDRFDLAGMDERMKQSDREYRLERNRGKQP